MSRSPGRSPQTEYRATLGRMLRAQNEEQRAVTSALVAAAESMRRRAWRAVRDVVFPFIVSFGLVVPMTPCARGACVASGSSSAAVVVAHGR